MYIFGAGISGLYAAEELQENGIPVAAFCDNNSELWGTEIVDGTRCIKLSDINKDTPFVIAVKERNVFQVTKQLEENNCKGYGVINK